MRADIGSQCKLMNRGVMCVLFGSLKINLAATFWIKCRVFNNTDTKEKNYGKKNELMALSDDRFFIFGNHSFNIVLLSYMSCPFRYLMKS